MSPKLATLSVSLAIFFTLTWPMAHSDCPDFENSVPKILSHFSIPNGFFPDDVKEMSCKSLNNEKTAYTLTIKLNGECKVTKGSLDFYYVVTCEPEITAIISKGSLTDLTGFTIIIISTPYTHDFKGEVGKVVVYTIPGFGDYLQFISINGIASVTFPLSFFPQKPLTCDIYASASNIYNGHPLLSRLAI